MRSFYKDGKPLYVWPSNCSERVFQNSEWIIAIDAWDYGKPDHLARLISETAIPDELRGIVSAIVSGQRDQKLRSASKMKVPADKRMLIAAYWLSVEEMFSACMSASQLSSRMAELGADWPFEDVDVRKEKDTARREFKENYASYLGLNEVRPLQDLGKELTEKIKSYPNI